MAFLLLIISLATGYILGSINTGMLVAKLSGVDIKKKGSGNAGLTNAMRVMGPRAAVVVFIGDVGKSVLACFLGHIITKGQLGATTFLDTSMGNLGVMVAGTGCIIGHIFPIFFGFNGGKGVLTSITVIFLMDYRIAFILLCAFLIIVLISRYVSLGSILSAACFPVVSLIFRKPPFFILYAFVIPIMVIVMHRKNIGRLISGTESKLKVR
ncbi:MAG: glycerol-3-phosphate 1-O-acyltransferase PlsY [Oscillospiraceae bacterium]|nr:glycerol-3-phosphate 1-O-acyltransferase PlsY [Oscillospiraceae bacterium]